MGNPVRTYIQTNIQMSITKNSHGVASLGQFGLFSEGTIGGFEIQGAVRFDYDDGKWTAVHYYNNPNKAIPYSGGYYLHDELPAYMVKNHLGWFVGTYDQLEQMLIKWS